MITFRRRFQVVSNSDHYVIVIYDLQSTALNNIFIANRFSRESHHRKISIILILQNLVHQGKYCRDISLNTH